MEVVEEKVTIEVSKKMYDQLMGIATEMTTQDPRGTRMPHMFQIRDWKKVYDWKCNGHEIIWVDPSESFEVETLDDLIEYLSGSGYFEEMEDYQEQSEIAEITRLWEENEIGGWISDNCENLEECSYTMEPVYINCFLTAKAAQEHLDVNHYHYHKDADVYLNHAWRNNEAEVISTFLCNLVGKDMHT